MSVARTIEIWQQHPAEGPGRIARWAELRGHDLQIVHAWENNLPVCSDSSSALILLGGPYSVTDGLDWLDAEQGCLVAWLASEKPVLGICLGAQVLSKALGAEVQAMGHAETGWCNLQFSNGAHMQVLQWHEYGFSLPKDAIQLASNNAWPCQMYVWRERVAAMQFHPAWDTLMVDTLNRVFNDASPLPHEDYPSLHHQVEQWLFHYLDAWLDGHALANLGKLQP